MAGAAMASGLHLPRGLCSNRRFEGEELPTCVPAVAVSGDRGHGIGTVVITKHRFRRSGFGTHQGVRPSKTFDGPIVG